MSPRAQCGDNRDVSFRNAELKDGETTAVDLPVERGAADCGEGVAPP